MPLSKAGTEDEKQIEWEPWDERGRLCREGCLEVGLPWRGGVCGQRAEAAVCPEM